MARRGGFFTRIVNAVRNVVAPRPEPQREAPRQEQPPREPTRRGRDREYREIWRNNNGRGNYRKHLSSFHAMVDSIEDDPDEREAVWDAYVKYMTKRGRTRYNSPNNPFWRISGIDPTDWKWAEWRQAMGYVGKRRSRTP